MRAWPEPREVWRAKQTKHIACEEMHCIDRMQDANKDKIKTAPSIPLPHRAPRSKKLGKEQRTDFVIRDTGS
jgi:hypothetical protein